MTSRFGRAVLLGVAGVLLLPASAVRAATSRPPSGPDTQVATTIPVGDTPDFVAADEATDMVYVGNDSYPSPSVSVINGRTDSVVATVGLPDRPEGIAVDPGTNRVFVVARDKIVVIDGRTNRIVATHAFNGIPVASDIADDPSTGLLYMSVSVGSNDRGYLYVISARKARVVAHVPVVSGLTAVKVSPSTNRIYVLAHNSVVVVSGSTRRVLATVALGSKASPEQLAVDQRTDSVYVTGDYGNIFEIDASSNTLENNIQDNDGPNGIAANGIEGYFYVTNTDSNYVGVYSARTGQVVAATGNPTGSQRLAPTSVVVDTATNTTYVTNQDANSVSVLVPSTGLTPAPSPNDGRRFDSREQSETRLSGS